MKLLTRSLLAVAAVLASSAALAGPILIVNGASSTSEIDTTLAVSDNLSALHAQAGNTVTLTDGLPADLSAYAQVWDVRFNNNAALDDAQQRQYLTYLQAGGGLFLMGENSSFQARNHSIFNLIALLGGGSIGFSECQYEQRVHAPFTGPNRVTQVAYAAPGCFDQVGSGRWISSDGTFGSGLAFGVGDLAYATRGTLTSILDVNFMMNVYDLPNSQELTKNLIGYVGAQLNSVEVPTPPALPLLLLWLGLFGAQRRRA